MKRESKLPTLIFYNAGLKNGEEDKENKKPPQELEGQRFEYQIGYIEGYYGKEKLKSINK